MEFVYSITAKRGFSVDILKLHWIWQFKNVFLDVVRRVFSTLGYNGRQRWANTNLLSINILRSGKRSSARVNFGTESVPLINFGRGDKLRHELKFEPSLVPKLLGYLCRTLIPPLWSTVFHPRIVSEQFLSATVGMSLNVVLNGLGQINAIKNVAAILIRFAVDRGQWVSIR